MSLLKEYINKILKENIDENDFVVLTDWLLEKGFRTTDIIVGTTGIYNETMFYKRLEKYPNFEILLRPGFHLETNKKTSNRIGLDLFQYLNHGGGHYIQNLAFSSQKSFGELINWLKEKFKSFEQIAKQKSQIKENKKLKESFEPDDFVVLGDWLMGQGFSQLIWYSRSLNDEVFEYVKEIGEDILLKVDTDFSTSGEILTPEIGIYVEYLPKGGLIYSEILNISDDFWEENDSEIVFKEIQNAIKRAEYACQRYLKNYQIKENKRTLKENFSFEDYEVFFDWLMDRGYTPKTAASEYHEGEQYINFLKKEPNKQGFYIEINTGISTTNKILNPEIAFGIWDQEYQIDSFFYKEINVQNKGFDVWGRLKQTVELVEERYEELLQDEKH